VEYQKNYFGEVVIFCAGPGRREIKAAAIAQSRTFDYNKCLRLLGEWEMIAGGQKDTFASVGVCGPPTMTADNKSPLASRNMCAMRH